jgi:hypothetical protein
MGRSFVKRMILYFMSAVPNVILTLSRHSKIWELQLLSDSSTEILNKLTILYILKKLNHKIDISRIILRRICKIKKKDIFYQKKMKV